MSLVEVVIDQGPVYPALDQLLNYVKLPVASIVRKLLYLKQGARETISRFVFKFRSVAINSGGHEERLKEALIGALSAQWQQQARAMLASEPSVDSSELIRKFLGDCKTKAH